MPMTTVFQSLAKAVGASARLAARAAPKPSAFTNFRAISPLPCFARFMTLASASVTIHTSGAAKCERGGALKIEARRYIWRQIGAPAREKNSAAAAQRSARALPIHGNARYSNPSARAAAPSVGPSALPTLKADWFSVEARFGA